MSLQGEIVAAHAALANAPDPPKPTRKRAPTHLAYPPPGADITSRTKQESDAQQTLQSNLKKVHAYMHCKCLHNMAAGSAWLYDAQICFDECDLWECF